MADPCVGACEVDGEVPWSGFVETFAFGSRNTACGGLSTELVAGLVLDGADLDRSGGLAGEGGGRCGGGWICGPGAGEA